MFQSVAGICGTNACFSSEGCRHVYERNEKECYLRDTNVTEPAGNEIERKTKKERGAREREWQRKKETGREDREFIV